MNQKSHLKLNLFFTAVFVILCGCTESREIGSKANPLKFYLIPAQDMMTLQTQGQVLAKYLEKELSMHVELGLPTSFIAVVEAFGSKKADVAILNTFGYILANEKYGVAAKLKLVNRGRDEYYGQIIAHVDGPKSIKEINNKRFAFVDPASTSGYVLPARLFKNENIKIKEHIFAGTHDSVVMAVYQRKVDAGATFHAPPDEDGTPKDARWIVRKQYPDVFEKIKILQLTGPIPNDPVSFRKDLPEEIKIKVVDALKKYIKTDEGKKVLYDLYHVTDFKEAQDKDYDTVRKYLLDLGKSANEFIK
jgi:phosphonate transport system substrate-binding protein